MKVCSTENMQIAERELIINGTPARTLMKLASAGIAEAVMQFFPVPGLCIAYVGKGNNGGDALTVLNILKQNGGNCPCGSSLKYLLRPRNTRKRRCPVRASP